MDKCEAQVHFFKNDDKTINMLQKIYRKKQEISKSIYAVIYK